ncbi:MAG: 2TM domain-containing protein [Solirubrobacterales bacterium]|nr:2TM domain-containing protein [Solirubrobacterales bacterium]
MKRNPNYDQYLTTATQLQRWRDFLSHVTAYVVVNAIFIALWAKRGRGFFWPAYPLIGWGLGLSFQHLNEVIRGPITEDQVQRRLNYHPPSASSDRVG